MMQKLHFQRLVTQSVAEKSAGRVAAEVMRRIWWVGRGTVRLVTSAATVPGRYKTMMQKLHFQRLVTQSVAEKSAGRVAAEVMRPIWWVGRATVRLVTSAATVPGRYAVRKSVFALAILSLTLGVDGALAANDAPDLRAAGPFPVGVTTAVLVDSKRTDAFTKEPRTLVTEIWYPATDNARQAPKNKYSDFLPGGVTPEIDAAVQKTYKMPVAEIDKLFVNDSVRDAHVRWGKSPLVIFSHGNGGNRHQNTFWCDFLASHGYVIVSADHV